ncbi:MAG: aminoglycoside phosphotransferase family protein [Eubacterium sp.]|nr:aminoglycoside phosphotransferase family protein [Eubacterium sp.]
MEVTLEKLISAGTKVDVYESGEYAVKVFKPNSPKTIVFYEAHMNSKIEETVINIPPIAEVGRLDDGRWAIASQFIKGKTLAEIMEEEPENRDAYLDDMVEIQLDIHEQTLSGVTKLKDSLRRQIESLDVIDHIKKYELLTRLDSAPKHIKLCHGNFGPENIIVTDDNEVFILDWVGASVGNASADIAKTYLKLSFKSTELAEKYMNLFCKKTGTSKKYVQEWLPIMAASSLASDTYTKEEREVLLTWLDVVDYS